MITGVPWLERARRQTGGLSERTLQRRLRDLLRRLDLRHPLVAEELCLCFGRLRGRPIVLVPTDLPGAGAFGALVPMRHKDLVIHQGSLPARHRETIIFHEFAHLFLQHIDTARVHGRTLVCNIDLAALDTFGEATVYDLREEWEAETCAAILSQWARAGVASPEPPASVEERAIQRGLGGSDWV